MVRAVEGCRGGLPSASCPRASTRAITWRSYDAEVLIRWGDPLVPGLAPFDPQTLRAGEQAQRFGYNNDYIAFFPLDETGARGSCASITSTRAPR